MNRLQESNDENRRRLLMDRSSPGRVGTTLPPLDVPVQELPDASLLREDLDLPEVSESELVRYFSQLSQFNFSIDHNFYPLGSCTMKYNPKLHDEIASLPGLTQIHPLQPASTVQGALQLLYELQEALVEITGMAGVSLAPMAGADGELAGMLMIRSYLLERGETQRKNVLIPDSAHGTNPASAAMAGFEVVTLPSDSDGNTDLDALRSSVDERLAGLMITLPSTLGLFDTNILDVCRIVHEAGGLVYGDGANLNALLGRVKLGDLGFDVIHSNLHKTFTQPHGGGGPGAGPVIVGPTLLPYLPVPVVGRSDGEDGQEVYSLDAPRRPSAGWVRSTATSAPSSVHTHTSGRLVEPAWPRSAKTPCSTPTTSSISSETTTISHTTGSACTRSSSPPGTSRGPAASVRSTWQRG